MRYVMKQKLFCWGDDFMIKDGAGRDVFFVDGKVFTLGDKLAFQDLQGNELAFIRQKLLAWGPTYEFSRAGQPVAHVSKRLRVHFTEAVFARDKRAGYVEAVKVALIRDAGFFESIERDAVLLREFDPPAMQRLIRRSAELHLDHIATSGDPFESGSARPLDFGHWSAHKLEQLSEYRLRHGEAVAIGIALDVVYGRKLGYLEVASAERILRLLEALGFDLFTNELLNADSGNQRLVLRGLEEFREHLGGELAITLLKAIGQGFEVHEMDLPRVLESIDALQQRHLAKGTARA